MSFRGDLMARLSGTRPRRKATKGGQIVHVDGSVVELHDGVLTFTTKGGAAVAMHEGTGQNLRTNEVTIYPLSNVLSIRIPKEQSNE